MDSPPASHAPSILGKWLLQLQQHPHEIPLQLQRPASDGEHNPECWTKVFAVVEEDSSVALYGCEDMSSRTLVRRASMWRVRVQSTQQRLTLVNAEDTVVLQLWLLSTANLEIWKLCLENAASTAPEPMVTKAPEVAAAVASVREQLVAYKELLLRQLLEQRESLVAAERDRKRADDADRDTGSSHSRKPTGSAASPPSSAGALEKNPPPPRPREPNGVGAAAEETAAEPLDRAPTDDTAAPPDGDSATPSTAPDATRRLSSCDAQLGAKRATSGSVADDNVARKKRLRESVAAALAADRAPLAKRVVRTAAPAKKKFVDNALRPHASGIAGALGVTPVLRGAAQDAALGPLRSRPRETPMEQIHGAFEAQLRASVQLASEARARTASGTRKRQLPRLRTPPRARRHWDVVLAEMQWLATDFAQERNWKRAMQFHLAKDVIVAQNAERVRHERESRQLAREVASQVSAFWRSMERIAARSRVRFEAVGGGRDDDAGVDSGDASPVAEIEAIDEPSASLDSDDSGVAPLRYKKIEVASGADTDDDETRVRLAKDRMKKIAGAGRKSRNAMLAGDDAATATTSGAADSASPREAALRDVQARASSASGGRTLLAAFQVLALRWMLELYTAGLNMFLNDQLGMGKAATISAFLSLVSLLDASSPSTTRDSNSDNAFHGPHLIVVAEDELHKWQFSLRSHRQQWRVQLYEGTVARRQQLQREWLPADAATATPAVGPLLSASEGEELWAEEREPVFCVLCPVSTFLLDQEAFAAFGSWQMLVVESEFDALFDEPATVAALQRVPQRRRRILCAGRPVESWTSASVRLQYAQFLVHDAASSELWSADVWTQRLLLDRASAARVLRSCGRAPSAVASLLKAAQHAESPDHVGALLVAMACLALRRVRSDVENQLGKVEEQSVSCQLSSSQTTQYRNTLAGFASSVAALSEREERLEPWLQLVLRLRTICNCVDIVHDLDKLALADLRLMRNCSAKLDALASLLARLVAKEEKRVLVYCQFDGLFPVLELFLSLLDVSFVRVSGSARMQRRALSHFAARPAVKVALASTRLASAHGSRAVAVYGADAVVVLDSDWNAMCDAKLRAAWAKLAVGKELVPVFRVHCEQTVEASLLRVGACLSEKAIAEMTPSELLAVPSDLLVGAALEKPSWWTSNATPGTAAAAVIARLGAAAQEAEARERYCGDAEELEAPLVVTNADLDAEEHLLLSNTDELTPVEWYAVEYVHGLTEKKRASHGSGGDAPAVGAAADDKDHAGDGWSEARLSRSVRTFDELATLENQHLWQDGDARQLLFYPAPESYEPFAPVDDATVEKLFSVLRSRGAEAQFSVYRPPQPLGSAGVEREVPSEPGATSGNEMVFRVSYRVPAPPPAPVAPPKFKSEQAHQLQQADTPGKPMKTKKPRSSSAAGAAGVATRPVGAASSAGGVTGVKRKLDQTGGFAKAAAAATKEQRVDLEGIPLPDVAEFEDDDFWGDTNLDALDSASWDDASVLSGILGPAVETSAGAPASGKAGAASTSHDGAGAGAQRASTKKTKGATGATGSASRARKGSVSADPGRDGWSPQDDLVLKKLFELYGSNWTLIAQVFNATTAVSRFCCKKRTPRQCYDRYGKIISMGLSAASSASALATKDGKLAKHVKTSGVVTSGVPVLSPEMLDARIGLPADELLLVFSPRNSLPGLPPPSIVNVSSLVELSMRKHKMPKPPPPPLLPPSGGAGDTSALPSSGGLDDLKSIRNSFDAIIQCMKRKTAPPPIPIPTPSAASAELGTKASLTASGGASFTPSPAASKAVAAAKPSGGGGVAKSPVAVQPPHKSHTDILSILPPGVVAPDDVIKRSKEVAAVQAAAAVASVGRDPAALSAAGDAILGAAFGSSTTLNRSKHYAGSVVGVGAAASAGTASARATASGVSLPHSVPGAKMSATSASMGATAAVTASGASASSPAWGDMSGLQHMARGVGGSMAAIDLNSAGTGGLAPGGAGLVGVVGAGAAGASAGGGGASAGGGSGSKPPMPVTTSTLLHVLDRMPEIKNKIQTILNRTDCSEAQKVTMIARLLSNTNAIANPSVLPPSAVSATPAPASHPSNAVSVVAVGGERLTGPAASSPVIDLETPIPMPPSLASTPTASVHVPAANAALLLESLGTTSAGSAAAPFPPPPNPTPPQP
ncbi:hypothetical protein PybrP1_002862 [[Pythium] brassicae (nom. inval.)]|nr:hypothetical protein PybrP1_002862 [[Pythium] brassicae (nom. inval.)]